MLSGSAAGVASGTARAGQALAIDTELDLPHDEDHAADVSDQDNSPPLGIMPVWHKRVIRGAMRPTKARLLSCPGRGPVPLPSVHPKARPFGVAYSSLALREAAKLKAKDPPARQLISARHPPPKAELCLPEWFEMPEKLPSPETAVALLAQANRAHQRYLKLANRLEDDEITYAPAAVLGANAAAAGTAGDFIKGHPLISRRAQANPYIPDDVPSLEEARAALEQFQTERMATLGSVSEPLAHAQEQLAALAASLSKDNAQRSCHETHSINQAQMDA